MFAGASAPPAHSGTTWSTTHPGQRPFRSPVLGQGFSRTNAARSAARRSAAVAGSATKTAATATAAPISTFRYAAIASAKSTFSSMSFNTCSRP